MDPETLANELARQGALLQEAEQAVRRLEQLTLQAEQRAKVAEEKAIAAVTAIGMVKIPEQKKIKLSNRNAEKFWPETYMADRADKKTFAQFLGEDETCLNLLARGLLASPLLERAAVFRDQAIVMSDVEA